jgi:hypothetical protein
MRTVARVDSRRVSEAHTPHGSNARHSPRRWFLPAPVSEAHALSVLLLGFAVEGATEGSQLLLRGSLDQSWLVYYITLATTVGGFYLIFLGIREWRAYRPRPVRRKRIPWRLIQLLASAGAQIGSWIGLHSRRIRRKFLLPWILGMIATTVVLVIATVKVDQQDAAPRGYRWPWFHLTLWAGGTAATAIVSIVPGTAVMGSAPLWIAAPVGGLLVLLLGSFFNGLRKEARSAESDLSTFLGWAGFAWSLGVATIAGYAIGERVIVLLTELVSNWVALVQSAAPIVVALSPLFVSYALVGGAFWPLLQTLRRGSSVVHHGAKRPIPEG